MREKTTVSQKSPADCVNHLVNFVLFVRKAQIENKYTDNNKFACDETSVWFDSVGNKTLERIGAKEVSVTSTGHEKMRLSVMLCAKADGTKCKPFVLLNRKRPIPSLIKRFKTLSLEFAGKTWMDDTLTQSFIDKVIGNLAFGRRLIVWDSFRAHISAATKKKVKDFKIDMAVIPGGCTRYIQAPDVSWNKPFKDKIKEMFDEYMASNDIAMTRYGNPAPPPLEVVCEWIEKAWASISPDIIRKSFKICGITTKVDGSEDDEIECFKPNKSTHYGREVLRKKNEELHGIQITELEQQVESVNLTDDNDYTIGDEYYYDEDEEIDYEIPFNHD